jgi:hypothetical protein
VVDFFSFFKVPLNQERIYDKDIAKNKTAAINEICKIENIPYSNITFLDDNIYHLLEPKELGVKCYMAKWGYGMKEHFEIANKYNIPITTINMLEKEIIKKGI